MTVQNPQNDEPSNSVQVSSEQVICIEITLIRSERSEKSVILNDYIAYLLEYECDLSIDKDPTNFT